MKIAEMKIVNYKDYLQTENKKGKSLIRKPKSSIFSYIKISQTYNYKFR